MLAGWGLVDDCTVTSHPGVAETVAAAAGRYSEDRVVIDGRTITSRAAGTAMEFAFVLVEQLCGAEQAAAVNQGVLARL